jgi:hypothetical protein
MVADLWFCGEPCSRLQQQKLEECIKKSEQQFNDDIDEEYEEEKEVVIDLGLEFF